MKAVLLATFMLFLIVGLASHAQAQSCNATATAAAFGTYAPTSPVATPTNATVTVVCNAPVSVLVSYTVMASAGSGAYAQRMLLSGSNGLAYQLYINSAHTQIWGDGTAGTATIQDGYLLNVLVPVTRSYTVYGLIPALQNAIAGTYADTIVVTISY